MANPLTAVMTPAPRTRRDGHPSLPLLLLGIIIAGSGIGQLARASYASLPEPERRAAFDVAVPEVQTFQPPSETLSDWAYAFGVPQPESASPPAEERTEETRSMTVERPAPSKPIYRLRGVMLENDRSLALLEGENGTEVVRVGGHLSGGQQLVEIRRDGVLIEGFEGLVLVAFPEADAADLERNALATARHRQQEAEFERTTSPEARTSHHRLRTAHSHHPQLQPPRFFRMTN